MKKKTNLSLALASLPLLAMILGACGGTSSSASSSGGSTSSSTSQSSATSSASSDLSTDTSADSTEEEEDKELENNTIYDAYEDNRPNYDDMFDFVPEYQQEELPDIDAEYTLSISEKSTITFADGSKTKTMKSGEKLTAEDFDTSSVTNRELVGVAQVVDGVVGDALSFDSFAMGRADVEIVPYFGAVDGFTALTYGSGLNSGQFNTDQVPGSFTSNETVKATHGKLINNGKGIYENGSIFTETSPIIEASALRTDIKTSLITETAVYEFHYHFENLGDYPINLNVYQISASSEYKGKYDYESRYRMDVDLEPGEAIEYYAQYKLDKNGNALFYAVADQNMDHGMVLGTSISMRKTDLTEPETVSEPEERPTIPPTPVTVSLSEGSPVKFKDGTTSKEMYAGDKLTSEDFDLSTVKNQTLAGIATVANGTPSNAKDVESYVVPNEPTEIVPYFSVPDGYTPLTYSSGSSVAHFNYAKCVGSFAENNTMTNTAKLGTKEVVKGTSGLYEEGAVFTETSSITMGSTFRTDNKTSLITEEKVYEFRYNFENRGDTTINLDVYQISSSSEQDDKSYEKRYRMDVDLEPGESITYIGQYKLGKNGNALTYFVADKAMPEGMVLATSISMKATDLKEPTTVSEPEESVKGTLILDLPTNFTVNDSYNTSYEIGANITLPTEEQITNNTGNKLLGWYVKGNLGDDFVNAENAVMKEGLTIAPYFDVSEGQLIQMARRIDHPDQSNIPDKFFNLEDGKTSDQRVNYDDELYANFAGSNYINADGNMSFRLKYNGKLLKNDYFRILSYCGATGTEDAILANHKYRFDITLTNFSSKDVNLKVSAVQGTEKVTVSEGAIISDAITLKPNETKSVSLTITLQSANTNSMTFFQMLQDNDALDLGMSMIKHNL